MDRSSIAFLSIAWCWFLHDKFSHVQKLCDEYSARHEQLQFRFFRGKAGYDEDPFIEISVLETAPDDTEGGEELDVVGIDLETTTAGDIEGGEALGVAGIDLETTTNTKCVLQVSSDRVSWKTVPEFATEEQYCDT